MEILGSIVAADYKGPRASFDEAHVLKALRLIGLEGRIGRGKLADSLALGSGEARTLIRRLKVAGLIMVYENGCTLTQEGQSFNKKILHALPWSSEVPSLRGLGEFSHAVILRDRQNKLNKGLEQRDAAVKEGAVGALTVLFRSGKFYIPSERTDCESRGSSEPWNFIRSSFPLKFGDIVIVSGGHTKLAAEYGAFSAALTLL